jgi:hypothetical protein
MGFIGTEHGEVGLEEEFLLITNLVHSFMFPPDRHTKQSHRPIIPDDVLIEFDLLMMST